MRALIAIVGLGGPIVMMLMGAWLLVASPEVLVPVTKMISNHEDAYALLSIGALLGMLAGFFAWILK